MVSVHPVKRLVSMVLVFAILLSMFLGTGSLFAAKVQAATGRQMEALDRGLVAVKTGDGVFLSWRLLGTESYDTSFNVYRNGSLIASNISGSTNYLDTAGSSSASYYVRSVVSGSEATQSDTVTPWAQNYMDVPLQKPANTTLNGATVTYSANDATVADVDGDGAYEIILKWDPSNSQDNSKSGYTSNVYVDCYEMNGTLRWRIDLGRNIRAGAHYTQIIAYDLNGDGKAEVAMKTADGTVDGQGNVIGDKDADYRNSSGYILSGPEYLTLFEGKTGKELVTIDYYPERGKVSSWGDSYGNRVDRFLAGVAYFDGKTPSLVVCRGYYTRCVIVSYEYKGGTLNREWVFDSNDSGNGDYAGEGNHNLSIADVDGDGYDEIVYGSAVIDHNGKGLYATGNGHGDALHVGDFDPDRAGLEVYQVHEETGSSIESIQFRDAATGKTIWSKKLSKDIGRGLILNIDPDFYPYVTLASNSNFYTKGGASVTSSISGLGINFASYWDGDLYREGLDGTTVRKWDYNNNKVVTALSGSNVHSNNSTKSTPSLSGDILGDWREEVIWPTSDDTALRIYTTTDVTDAKLYTLMHDSQYRCAIAWQNVAYNQPPHTSYFIGPTMAKPTQPSIYTVGNYTLAAPDSGSGEAHTHSYTSSVSLAATCESEGVRSYICACGASYSEAIPALGHSYQNDVCANCGQLDPNSETAQASGYIHNFTSDQLVSSFYTISGNLSAKGTVSYGGMSLTRCLKMESATSVTFNPTRSGKLMLVFHKTGYNVDAVGQTVMLDGTAYTVLDGGDYAYVEIPVSAGAHELKRGSGQIFLYYMAFTPNASGETHTHSYTSSVTTAATCTASGVRTYSCSCGSSYTEAIAALGHSYSGGSCTRCGAADPNYNPGGDVVVPAGSYIHNFTDDGFTSDFYTFAGGQITDGKHGTYTYDFGNGTETLNNALKFDSKGSVTFTAPAAGKLTIAVASSSAGRTVVINNGSADIGTVSIDTASKLFVLTVDVSANVSYTIARDSGESGLYYIAFVPNSSTGGDVHTHSYTESITTAATCDKAGVKTFTCSCGDSYTEAIAALGHRYSSRVTAPTCTEGGYTTYTCSACGNSYTGNQTAALGHSYSSSVTLVPDCTNSGVRSFTCSACGHSYTESIPALGHSEVTDAAVAATCTTAGKTEGKHCSVCNTVLVAQQTVPAKGHTNAAAVKENEKPASCAVNGSYDNVVYCSVCGVEVSRNTVTVPATGAHVYATESQRKDATCTADGYVIMACGCGATQQTTLKATGHTEVTDAAVAATCTAAGKTEGKHCSVCGYISVAQQTVAAKGHSFANGVCTVCGAKDPEYVAGVTVSGKYTSYNDAADVMTIQLIAEGKTEPAYVFTNEAAPANAGEWRIEGVAPGNYTVKVMKADHVTREYALTVGDTAVTQNVMICLLGDVNNDGNVNISDYVSILTQVKNPSAPVLVDYCRQCADTDGNGAINFMDYLALLSHVKNVNRLW